MARDYTDTAIIELRKLIEEETPPQRSDASGAYRQVLKDVEHMAREIKEQRKEIIELRLKGERSVSRQDVTDMAAIAALVVTERVNNLWKFITASHLLIGALISFIAAKVFGNGH